MKLFKRGKCDYSLLFIIIFLLGFGLVMLYSTSSYSAQLKFNDGAWFLKKQIFATSLGIIAMMIVSRLEYKVLEKVAFIAYGASICLIFGVLTPLGIDAYGAKRWIGIGPISFQPAEAVKLAVIVIMAYIISKTAKNAKHFSYIIKILLISAIPAGLLLVITNNLSSALIVMIIAFVMLFVASPKYRHFIIIIGVVGVAALVLLTAVGGFRAERIRVWQNPEQYSQQRGYQVLQGLYAIGSGGIFGKGLGQSVQKLGYVPEAQNDMVFSIICEELGLIGAIAVIVMFLFMIWRFMVIASNAPDLFGSMLVIGIMSHISIQAILNIAVVTNTIPNTGVTLPFISYGGTSVLFLLVEMGIALSVSRSIYNQETV